ncbi:MAG: hypothetical protein KGI06_02735 [Candidatus Micrarchaeota archaeon]|nr:hypothetical protein [Candidatus Micrarchaeota archaeon]
MAKMKMVEVHRNGKVYKRRQPLHHKIGRRVLKRELKRLKEQEEVIKENVRKAKRRVMRGMQ